MKCRCGHDRRYHYRKSGKKRMPCNFAPFSPTPCKCRNFVP